MLGFHRAGRRLDVDSYTHRPVRPFRRSQWEVGDVCGVGDEEVFSPGDEDWFGEKAANDERVYREERRKRELRRRIEQDEIDFGEPGDRAHEGEAEPEQA